MSRRRVRRPSSLRAGAAALGLAGLTGLLGSCSLLGTDEAESAPARPTPVALSPETAPEELSIGVVVSLGSPPGQGSDWSEAAEGAQVAAYRYRLGDVRVDLRARDDQGTAAGATEAVEELVDEGVAGIVLATEGSHVRPALATAAEAGVPVLMPYETDGADLPDGVWLTGPDRDQIAAVLASALEAEDAQNAVLVDAGGGELPGVPTVDTLRYRAGDDAEPVAAGLARGARSGAVDAVVVSGPAQLQARVVRALQGEQVDLPVLLTPSALSPSFPAELAELDGTLAARLSSAGPDAGDVAAMAAGEHGEALSAYFAALRAAADDETVTGFFDGGPFVDVSDAADTRSHDAVVALVTAANLATSADPAEVAAALPELVVTHDDGLAGPDLDFSSTRTLADEDVVVLQGTPQGPGLRPAVAGTQPQLFWFAAPGS